MAIRAVIFDIGGVLEHTPPTGWNARWARELGMQDSDFDARLAPIFELGSLGRIDLEEVHLRIAEALDLDGASSDALMHDVWGEYLGTLNEALTRYFAGLRPRLRTGILSNSFVGAREREAAAYGFPDLCDVLVYSHEEGLAKPDPAFYAIACERLGVPATGTAFLDDLPGHVMAARRLGMTGVVFHDTAQAIAELEAILG